MSKAFVNEDAAPEAIALRSAPTVGRGELRYITSEGHHRLAAELAEARAQLAAEGEGGARGVRRADLLDRIRVLEATLGAVTVAPAVSAPGRACFGAWIELQAEDGEQVAIRLVGPDEVDARAGQISVDSPLGRAVLGREEGDEVVVHRPVGDRALTIVRIGDAPPRR